MDALLQSQDSLHITSDKVAITRTTEVVLNKGKIELIHIPFSFEVEHVIHLSHCSD